MCFKSVQPPMTLSAEEVAFKIQCELLTAYVSAVNQEQWSKGLTSLAMVRSDMKHAHPIAEITVLARDYPRTKLVDRSNMVMVMVDAFEIKRNDDRLENTKVLKVFMRADY